MKGGGREKSITTQEADPTPSLAMLQDIRTPTTPHKKALNTQG